MNKTTSSLVVIRKIFFGLLTFLVVSSTDTGSSTTTNKTFASVLVTAAALDSTWQPWGSYSWDNFPSLYFAANPEGNYSNAQLDKLSRFKLVMIEFRQSQFLGEQTGSGKWADGDEGKAASAQCQMLKQRCISQNNIARQSSSSSSCPPCLTYRSGEWAGTMYPSQENHMRTNQDLYLTSTFDCDGFTHYPLDIINEPPNDSGIERCRPDFRLQGARDFFIDIVIDQNVARDSNVDGVFIDNGQSVACDNEQESSDLTFNQRQQMQRSQLDAYIDAFTILNDRGKYPILSTTNRYASVDTPLVPWGSDCPDSEDVDVSALHAAGVVFARNNEFFMWNLGSTCRAQMQNAVLEAQAGVPLIVHTPYFRSGNGCLEGCFNDDDSKITFDSMSSFLEFSMAAFLAVAGTGSYFGFSDMEDPKDEFGLGGWADSSWPYFPQYDSVKPGPPLGDAVVTNNGWRYTREFQRLTVVVDCHTGEYSLISKSSSSPTQSPTVLPSSTVSSSSCEDSVFRFKITGRNGKTMFKPCSWVARVSTAARCEISGVAAMCPKTCNTCSTCEDSSSRMKINFRGRKIRRNCKWTANNPAVRCEIEDMPLACRDTCGLCE